MIVHDNRGSERIPIPVFKIDDFNKFIIALELILLDFRYVFKQSLRIKCEKEIPKLVPKIYTIIKIITPIERKIYKNNFSWKDINIHLFNMVYNNHKLTITLEDYNRRLLNKKEGISCNKNEKYLLYFQLDLINKLHDGEQVFMDDLAPLQEREFKSLNNSFKVYFYDWVLFGVEYSGLTFEDLEFIYFLIDESLKLKKDKELEDAQDIIVGFFNAFYSHIDYIIG